MTLVLRNSQTMFKRCLVTSLRNPETIGTAILVPAMVMALFGLVFGNAMDVGEFSYIDFIVPGIILQTTAQAASGVAVSVNNDMKKGLIDRFRSMDISKSSVLTGHVLAAVVRNIIATAVVIVVALALGFRPQASFLEWLIIAAILILYMFVVTWIAVICGLVAKTPESAGMMPFPLFILPYVSSGFVPVESVSPGIRWFAEYQPMTPIIDSLRALMLNQPVGNSLVIGLAWSVGMIVVAFMIAVRVYRRRA